MNAVYIGLGVFALLYALWILYLAVMNLKRAKDAGLLTPITKALGYPVLFAGLVVNMTINFVVFTVILLEFPRETLVSERLKRHNRNGKGWRKSVAMWFEPLLDPFDPSGDHI